MTVKKWIGRRYKQGGGGVRVETREAGRRFVTGEPARRSIMPEGFANQKRMGFPRKMHGAGFFDPGHQLACRAGRNGFGCLALNRT